MIFQKGVSHSPSGCPTLERITPGEILSELSEITTPVRFWPKFLENHTAVNLQKISCGLTYGRAPIVWGFTRVTSTYSTGNILQVRDCNCSSGAGMVFPSPILLAVPITAAQIPWRVSAMHTDVFIPVYFVLKSTKHFIFSLHDFWWQHNLQNICCSLFKCFESALPSFL